MCKCLLAAVSSFLNSILAELKKTLIFPEESAFQEIHVSEMTSQSMQLASCNSTRCVCGLAGLKRLRKSKKNPKAINI